MGEVERAGNKVQVERAGNKVQGLGRVRLP